MAPAINEGQYLGDWLKWEQSNLYSREAGTLASDAAHDLKSGAVLGELTASPGVYHELDPGAVDGTEVAAAVLLLDSDASAAAQEITVVKRQAIVHDKKVIWPGGITAPQTATAITELEAIGILVREGA